MDSIIGKELPIGKLNIVITKFSNRIDFDNSKKFRWFIPFKFKISEDSLILFKIEYNQEPIDYFNTLYDNCHTWNNDNDSKYETSIDNFKIIFLTEKVEYDKVKDVYSSELLLIKKEVYDARIDN
jgi:hypothetical protein